MSAFLLEGSNLLLEDICHLTVHTDYGHFIFFQLGKVWQAE